MALELDQQLTGRVALFERSAGSQEIARVRETVGADRAEFGQAEQRAVILADIACGPPVGQCDPEFDAARDKCDLAGRGVDYAELGTQPQAPVLRYDQQLAVDIAEHPVGHRAIGTVDMNPDTVTPARIAIRADRRQTLDKIG